MATYGEVQSRIADEMARSDLTTQIQNAIQSAIAFYEKTMFWFKEAETTIATVVGQESYSTTFPSDFDEFIELTVTVSGNRYPMKEETYSWIRDRLLLTTFRGRPEKFAIFKSELWTYPLADAVYTMTLSYYKTLAVLSGASGTNAWTTYGEELIRCRAKSDLYKHVIRNKPMSDEMKMAEREALQALMRKSTLNISTGRIKPTQF